METIREVIQTKVKLNIEVDIVLTSKENHIQMFHRMYDSEGLSFKQLDEMFHLKDRVYHGSKLNTNLEVLWNGGKDYQGYQNIMELEVIG